MANAYAGTNDLLDEGLSLFVSRLGVLWSGLARDTSVRYWSLLFELLVIPDSPLVGEFRRKRG